MTTVANMKSYVELRQGVRKTIYKSVVVGLDYVSLSNAVLLAQNNTVIGIDLSQERVDMLNSGRSPVVDRELSEFLSTKKLDFHVNTNLNDALHQADFVIISTPTNYDEKSNQFDTSSVETVIATVVQKIPSVPIIIKSTIPVGFTDRMRAEYGTDTIIFSPEFLREGRALYDNLSPAGSLSVISQSMQKHLRSFFVTPHKKTISQHTIQARWRQKRSSFSPILTLPCEWHFLANLIPMPLQAAWTVVK